MAIKKFNRLSFDRQTRVNKGIFIFCITLAINNSKNKTETYTRLVDYLNIVRENPKGQTTGAGTYMGTKDQFVSQYTPALEFGIIKDTKNDSYLLSDLALQLANGEITPEIYISTIFLNLVQIINGEIVHPLKDVLKKIQSKENFILDKNDIENIFSFKLVGKKDDVNVFFQYLSDTIFFKIINSSTLEFRSNIFDIKNLLLACEEPDPTKISDLDDQENYSQYITKNTFLIDTLKFKNNDLKILKTDFPLNRIIYGAPGTGKSHLLEIEAKSIFQRRIKKRKTTIDDDLSKPNYWIATCGANNSYWNEFYDGSYFAVGWNKLGNLKTYNTKSEMENWLKKSEDKTLKADSQWAISYRLRKGDYIVIRRGIKDKRIVGYGVVNGDYELNESLSHFQQSISVEWKSKEEKILSNYNRNFPITSLVNMNDDLEAEFKKEYLGEDISSEWEEEFSSTVERVTFYDGYTHGQFVGTYKPVPDNDSITYKYIPGPFMKQLIMALKNPEDKFCLIIEEINRARADKVFGNIFQLLDRKNGKSQFPVMLSEDQIYFLQDELSKEYPELFNELLSDGLYIPENLYIWATMNSADQGVYALDSAFKRRWHFKHIGLDDNEDKFFDEDQIPGIMFQKFKNDNGISHDAISWNKFRHVINKRLLNAKVFEDRLIAPFFVKPTDFIREEGMTYIKESFFEIEEGIFLDKVLMYLFDDVLKHKNKNILFKSEYESFSELKKGYRNTEFDELPNIHSIFKDSLREDLEVISIEEGLSCNKKTITDDSETEEQGS